VVKMLRPSFISKKPDGKLPVVTGEGHKFVKEQSFLLSASLRIPGPPFHQLGCTGLGHRFLLFR